jgi:hypothetical protein
MYLDALVRHIQETGVEPGKVTHVEVRHDDDCAFWRRRPCDCEPSIVTGPAIDRKHGGADR